MRITGGAFRSRNLAAPRGHKTRPTSDRVREALFSILASRVEFEGVRVLDLYAGTGALALEAVSRGAAHATLIEKDRAALDAIRSNIEALDVRDRVRVVAASVERGIESLREDAPFDLAFADPPYADIKDAASVISQLASTSRLAAGATLVLEHASSDEAPTIAHLALESSRRYGDTQLSFYSFADA
jgi:16S rRNA (guanine966-N2)-methyltransferase